MCPRCTYLPQNEGVAGGDLFDPKNKHVELRPGAIFDRDLSDFHAQPSNTRVKYQQK
jgi:hypothetical protein